MPGLGTTCTFGEPLGPTGSASWPREISTCYKTVMSLLATEFSPAGLGLGVALFWAIVVLLWTLYWLPALIALMRGHPRAAAVVFINVVLGWTGIWWLVALVMACVSPRPSSSSPLAARY